MNITKKILLFISFLLFISKAYVQECQVYEIQDDYLGGENIYDVVGEWASSGANFSSLSILPERQFDVTDYEIYPDMEPCGQEIIDLIDYLKIEYPNSLKMLYFPNGAYLIDKPLVLTGLFILKGAGGDGELSGQTHFHFDLGFDSGYPCISISGERNGVEDIFIIDDTPYIPSIVVTQTPMYVINGSLTYGVTGATNMYTTNLGVCSGSGTVSFNIGSFFCSGTLKAGVPYNVTTVFSNNIESITKNHTVYSLQGEKVLEDQNSIVIQKDIPNIINENDSLKSKIPDIYYQHTINISGSYNWIRGVESAFTRRFHVYLTGENNTISGCYFHHSINYSDDGGRGYGICLSGNAYKNRIEDNIFKHLRHSMVLQGDAEKNVFGYNFSTDVYANNSGYTYNAADLLLHGSTGSAKVGPKLNLLESNYVVRSRVDAVTGHGPNGPYNVFFRDYVIDFFKIYDKILGSNEEFKKSNLLKM